MRLLIAYDGSSYAIGAIDDLTDAALPKDTEAVVMTVADVFLPPESTSDDAVSPVDNLVRRARARVTQALENAGRFAETGRDHVRARFPGWKVEALTCADSPAWGIIKKAEAWNADLVVVGAQGHSALARLMLGSVSQKILNEVPCSVRIGRARRKTGGPLRIMVGVDGSARSEAAVRRVAARAWPAGTEARTVAVLDLKVATLLSAMESAAALWVRESDGDETAWVRRMAELSAESLRETGLSASSAVLEGDPRRALLEEAARWEADCIFVGATGLGAFERLLLGTVSAAVAGRAHCSVEVVRPPRERG